MSNLSPPTSESTALSDLPTAPGSDPGGRSFSGYEPRTIVQNSDMMPSMFRE